ncbi:MAG: hypothetical protein R2877_00345 [Bdellovibrionota bacterium]
MSCEHSRITFGGWPDTPYHKTLQSQTKYERLYGLDKALYETYITYVTPQLAEEYVNEYARIFSLNDFKKETMMAERKADLEKYDEFMVVHYASENDNIRLNNQDPKTVVWKFFLKTDDTSNGMVEAVEINNTQLGTQRKYFYPHMNEWARLYRVRFPKTATVGKTLVMKGTVRELTFVWK